MMCRYPRWLTGCVSLFKMDQCKVARTVKMFYRLWRADLRAKELECWSAEAFTSRCHIMKDKLMGSREEVDHNALCGPGPAETWLFNRNLNLADEDALGKEGQQRRESESEEGGRKSWKGGETVRKTIQRFWGLANVATECLTQSKFTSILVSRVG